MTVEIEMPSYLRQWFIYKMGGSEPITLPRSSVYMSFLRVFLRNKRDRESYVQISKDTVSIVVPRFPGKDPVYYNYLPVKARQELCNLVRDSFDVELFRDMGMFEKATQKKKGNELLSLWMEEHGIEVSDRNWSSVAKRLQMLRKRSYDRDRKRKIRNVQSETQYHP